jgi:hypothetical protein
MSNLLLASQVYGLTGLLSSHFDTFSSGKNLFVFKEPKKTIISNTASIYNGYPNSNEPNFTLTPVSGIFPCTRVHQRDAPGKSIEQIHVNILDGETRVKVREDARNFIRSGRNESFELEGITYREAVEETPQNFFGLKFYYFTLKKSL